MARRVTQTAKDTDGDILALCNPDYSWSPRRKSAAITDIELGLHSYYVLVGSKVVSVHVVNDPSGKYLRTDPDETSGNNLNDLPDCSL